MESVVTCKNCAHQFQGHFCNHCGQDAHTDRIDAHFVLHELQHSFFHLDSGLSFTLTRLFLRPGLLLTDFIQGRRVGYFKPISLVLLLAGLFALLNHWIDQPFFLPVYSNDLKTNAAVDQVEAWASTHYALLTVLQLPLLAYVCYRAFRSYGTNYLEQVVINAYLSSQRLVVRIGLLPLSHWLPKPYLPWTLGVDMLVSVGLFLWSYQQYYMNRSQSVIIIKALIGYILNYVLILVFLSVVLSLMASL